MIQVEITFCAWRIGVLANSASSVTFQACLSERAVFKDLLHHLLHNRPALKNTLVDPTAQQLQEDIIVIVNGKFLDLAGGMQTHLKDGDRIQFLPCIPGG